MPDEAAPESGAEPLVGEESQPPAGAEPTPPEGEGTTLSVEDARKLRSEARNLRARAKAAEDKLAEKEGAELSATQKLEREKSGLEAQVAQLETRLRDASVQAIASRVGVKADLVDTVSALIDWDEVDADDPKEIERSVKALIKERPSLSARPEGVEGGRRTRQDGADDVDSIIRRAAGRLPA
jgi:hypothetical protein